MILSLSKFLMKFLFLNAFVFIFVPFLAQATQSETRAVMHYFYMQLSELRPQLTSEQEFKNPKNRKKISRALERLEKKVRKAQPKQIEKAPGFAVTYDLLARHLRETKRIFDSGELDYARMKFNSTTAYCIACHTRLPKDPSKLGSQWRKAWFSTDKTPDLEDAEFLYIGRQFDRALDIYDKFITNYKKSPQSEKLLEKALNRKLTIHARVFRRPKIALKSFQKDLKNKSLPLAARKNIESWVNSFKKWSKEEGRYKKMKSQKFITEIEKSLKKTLPGRSIALSSPELVELLRISGHLYGRIFDADDSKTQGPKLYWLARIERHLNPLKMYSLADIYLKECVRTYATQPIAQRCLSEYRKSTDTRYPGKKPQHIQLMIDSLESQLSQPSS